MIITNATGRSQQVLGKFKPQADQSKFGSRFAVVEGRHTAGWPTLRDITTNGTPIHDGSKGYLKYTEYLDSDGKPNDVVLENGTVVREVFVERKYIDEVNKIEAGISTDRLNDFLTNNNLADRKNADGTLRMSGEVITSERETEFTDVTTSASSKPRGRPPKQV